MARCICCTCTVCGSLRRSRQALPLLLLLALLLQQQLLLCEPRLQLRFHVFLSLLLRHARRCCRSIIAIGI